MSLQLIIYFSFLFFLLGVFGIFYSKDIISVFVSYQFIIISAAFNFLGFSQFLYRDSIWDKIFIIFGVISIYLLMFCIVFYLYSNLNYLDKKILLMEFRLFRIEKSNWWGEDNL